MVQYSFILINCIIIIANNNNNNMNNVKYKFTIENGVIKSISKNIFKYNQFFWPSTAQQS